MGLVPVANEPIPSGRGVVKHVVSRVDGWPSLDVGALGIIAGGQAIRHRAPRWRHTTDNAVDLDRIKTADDLPQVDALCSDVDASPALIGALVEDGAEAIIVAAVATGSAHAGRRPPLAAAREQGVKVAIASRGGNGRFTVEGGHCCDPSAGSRAPQKASIPIVGLIGPDDGEERQRRFLDH